jgi:cytochrome c553
MDDERAKADRRWGIVSSVLVAAFLAISMFVAFIGLPVIQARSAGIDTWTAICRAVGVLPGTPARPQPSSTARAEPVSRVSWSPGTLTILARGDLRIGASLAGSTCVACHGERGVSPAGQFPHLAGQSAAAIFKQLSDYQTGARVSPLMTPVARALTTEQMAQVARYYAGANTYGALGPRIALPDLASAVLVSQGDVARRMPPCQSCHGAAVAGPIETPTLNGQHQDYLAAQLRAFRTGQRRNDVYARMRDIAGRLSEAEIDALAAYYQGLR